GRVQAAWRLPCSISNAANELAVDACRLERKAAAVAGHGVTFAHQSANANLEALDRGVDESSRAARPRFFSQDVPGFDGLPQLNLDAFIGATPVNGESELEEGVEP